MVKSQVYIEGGESKEDQVRCRKAFRTLLEKAGFSGRMPRLSACGSRNSAFGDFKTAIATKGATDYVALLVDSEDPVSDLEKTWDHLGRRDRWEKPEGATDENVFFMTTCMESWIVSDRPTLKKHYGSRLQENMLPPLDNLEQRTRHDIHDKLVRATSDCSDAFAKGKRSFEVLEVLDVAQLKSLPSFARMIRILDQKL